MAQEKQLSIFDLPGMETERQKTKVGNPNGMQEDSTGRTSAGGESVEIIRGIPLAERLRPQSLEEFAGQTHLIGEGGMLRRLIESDHLSSMIFWGPPGVGKTTLAQIIAKKTRAQFINFSAVTSGIKEIRTVMQQAEENRRYGERTILFVDEIHRFNKAQQDAFLPFVEKGSIILIGATTENPSFEINSALLSRCKVFVLKALETEDLIRLLQRAIHDERGFGAVKVLWRMESPGAATRADVTGAQTASTGAELAASTGANPAASIGADPDAEAAQEEIALRTIATFANGDARSALTTLEMVILNGEIRMEKTTEILTISRQMLEQCLGKKALLYDKDGEEHYNLISALHKSMRNSDADAAIYWLCRMLEAGEDPLYIARRIVRFASEDVGLADTNALTVAVNAYQSCHLIGMPECCVHLTEAAVYMSLAPKSNAMEVAYNEAKEDVARQPDAPVPLHIRNGVTSLMKEIGYGRGYQYAHDYEEKVTAMTCLPDELADREYYHPTTQGMEKKWMERKNALDTWKREHRGK